MHVVPAFMRSTGTLINKILMSFPARCLGGAVLFTINNPFLRIKPLALASGHGRHIAVTPERTFFPVEEWPSHTAVINL